ncbi:MAG: hypothetical protein JRH20_26415 [Deltaproteobacteria bacterium]|nr:hypothetical protein [Deltaproteobacteria bacterium]
MLGDIDLKSAAYDFVVGIVGQKFTASFFKWWNTPLWAHVHELQAWTDFAKREGAYFLYNTVSGIARSYVWHTPAADTAWANNLQGLLMMVQMNAMHAILASPMGKMHFPLGFADPKVAGLIRSAMSTLNQFVMRAIFDVAPSLKSEQKAKSKAEAALPPFTCPIPG